MKPRLKSMGRRFLLTPLFRLMGTPLAITIIHYIPSIYRHGTLTQSNGSLILPLKLIIYFTHCFIKHTPLITQYGTPTQINRSQVPTPLPFFIFLIVEKQLFRKPRLIIKSPGHPLLLVLLPIALLIDKKRAGELQSSQLTHGLKTIRIRMRVCVHDLVYWICMYVSERL